MSLTSPQLLTREEQEALVGDSTYTTQPCPEGYVKGTEVAKTLNEALKAVGIEHEGQGGLIKPQMVYNYANKGYIKTDAYPHIPEQEAQKWIEAQFHKRCVANNIHADENEDMDVEDTEEQEV